MCSVCVDTFRYTAYVTPRSAYVTADIITSPVLPPRRSAHVTTDVITTPVVSPRGKEPTEYAPMPVGQFRSGVKHNACILLCHNLQEALLMQRSE